MAEDICEYLNELFVADPEALHKLVEARVPCNEALTDHPTVQVVVLENGTPAVGVLGIINGLIGVDEDSWGYVSAVFNDNGHLSGFEVRRDQACLPA